MLLEFNILKLPTADLPARHAFQEGSMRVESSRSKEKDLGVWSLADWNRALYSHFFVVRPNVGVSAITRLYVTAESLRAASGSSSLAKEARTAFVSCMQRTLGPRSLALDASHRRGQWDQRSAVLPPFLSHLVLTCMVANDLAEELCSTGDFRKRLSQTLGTESQPGLERLRPLWEELAAWSVQLNLSGAGCRILQLPEIPDSGYHSIIGYSIRLAFPSRRDQSTLAMLLREHELDGREPELDSVLHVISANVGKFGSDFRDVFDDFVLRLKGETSSALFYTTFWTVIREVALAGVKKSVRDPSGARVRLELEDDDGTFWLALSCDRQLESDEIKSLGLSSTRQSSFRFLLTDQEGNSFVGRLIPTKRGGQVTEKLLSGIRSLIDEGLLLFEEREDNIFVLANALPVSGQLRALVSDRIRATFQRATESVEIQADVTRSLYQGWSEWRGLRVEELRKLEFARFPLLARIRSLRLAIVRPEIRLRAGIRVGGSYVAISGGLPQIEASGADSVIAVLRDGERHRLQKLPETDDLWAFAPTLPAAQLLGSLRVVAFVASAPIAEREVNFIETSLTSDYKQPTDPSRWLIESMSIDSVSYSENLAGHTGAQGNGELVAVPNTFSFDATSSNGEDASASDQSGLVRLTTSLCCRFAAQRGIPEGELVSLLTSELGIKVRDCWPILRSWVEAGILEVLIDARWRSRLYFGRKPQIVVYQRSGYHEAALIGLVPPFLLERFSRLLSTFGLTSVDRRSVSPFVPALPRCRSIQREVFNAFAQELNLPPVFRFSLPEGFIRPVRTLAEHQTTVSHDSWPLFRRWDWQEKIFLESSSGEMLSGISLDWCRRDDGPDRYKLYRDGSLLWWTRSRTWALLAAFTLAGEPSFNRRKGGSIESRGDSLYLPLPLARFICWTGLTNSGPVTAADGKNVYCYTFPNEKIRESVLALLWPEGSGEHALAPAATNQLLDMFRPGQGPVVPIPAGVRMLLADLLKGQKVAEPRFVPVRALPYLFATLRATLGKGKS